jgi:hypothetical protein
MAKDQTSGGYVMVGSFLNATFFNTAIIAVILIFLANFF